MKLFTSDVEYAAARSFELEQIYKQTFTKHIRLDVQHPLNVKGHVDMLVEWNGNNMWIEEKCVRQNYRNIYIETVSCARLQTPGWIYHSYDWTELPVILEWVFPSSLFFIDMRKLQMWWDKTDHNKYFEHQNNTNNKTKGRLVPLEDIQHLINYKIDL